jgi:2TM domain
MTTDLRTQAIDRLKKRQDFHAHLLVYTLVSALLWTIWALTGASFPWPLIVMGGWGVGLVMNAWDVYARKPIGEAEVQREIERLRGA